MTTNNVHTIPLASTKEANPGEQLMLAFQAPAPCVVVDARTEDGVEIVEIIAGPKKVKREAGDARPWAELLGQAPVPPDGYIMVVVKNATDAAKLLAAELAIAPIAVAQVVPGSVPGFVQNVPNAPPRSVAEPFMRAPGGGGAPRGPVNQPFMRQQNGNGGIQTRVIPGGKHGGGNAANGPVIQTRVIPGGKRSGTPAQSQPAFTPIGRVVPQQQAPFGAQPQPQAQPHFTVQSHQSREPQGQQRGPYVMRPNGKKTGINVRRVVTARGKSVRAVVGRKATAQMRATGFGQAARVLIAAGPGECAVVFRPGHAQALLHKVEHNTVIPKTHVAPILRGLATAYDEGAKSTGGSDVAVCFKVEYLAAIATVVQHSGARLQEPARSEVVHALKEAFARLESVSRRNVQAPSPSAVGVAPDAFVEHVVHDEPVARSNESDAEVSEAASAASGES